MIAALILFLAAPMTPSQVLAGPAFERFVAYADALCPERRFRLVTPGDLDWAQEVFEDGLPAKTLARLKAHDDGTRRCADRNGLSCQVGVTLTAIERTGLMPAFAASACAHPLPR